MIERHKLRAKRQNIPDALKESYQTLLYQNFIHAFSHLANLNIASYCALDEEISPLLIDQFLKSQNNNPYYPVLHPLLKRHLWFVKDSGHWITNKYNLREPRTRFDHILEPWALDVVIVPLVGFDRNKHRIGMGSGFYDCSFAFRKKFNTPQLIGIAFDEQMLDSIAISDWDIKMDNIITPTQII